MSKPGLGFDHGVHLLWISPAIKALVRNLSAFSTLFAPGKSWDNVRSTAAPYTESRLARLVRNKRVGFRVVEQHTLLNRAEYTITRKRVFLFPCLKILLGRSNRWTLCHPHHPSCGVRSSWDGREILAISALPFPLFPSLFPYWRLCPCPLSLLMIMFPPSFPIFDYAPSPFPYFWLCPDTLCPWCPYVTFARLLEMQFLCSKCLSERTGQLLFVHKTIF